MPGLAGKEFSLDVVLLGNSRLSYSKEAVTEGVELLQRSRAYIRVLMSKPIIKCITRCTSEYLVCAVLIPFGRYVQHATDALRPDVVDMQL